MLQGSDSECEYHHARTSSYCNFFNSMFMLLFTIFQNSNLCLQVEQRIHLKLKHRTRPLVFFWQYLADEARKKQELESCKLSDFQVKTTLGKNRHFTASNFHLTSGCRNWKFWACSIGKAQNFRTNVCLENVVKTAGLENKAA
jgi:hypothetical protein